MEIRTPLKAMHPARRLAALMRFSRRARRRILRALSRRYTTWAQRQRQLIKSQSATTRDIYYELANWIAREGQPVWAGRAYIADACDCHPDTVTKAVRKLVALGLLLVRERRYQDKRTGRWHQASNVYALPDPLSELGQDRLRRLTQEAEQRAAHSSSHRIGHSSDHTQIKTKKTLNKVASGPGLEHKRDRNRGWEHAGPILSRMIALGTVKLQE